MPKNKSSVFSLQSSDKNRNGFTLVELLITIVIISILAVIGVTFFANSQKRARDAVRRSEIGTLAKSIETSMDSTATTYTYTSTTYGNDFPQSKPKDPSNSTPTYCIATSTTSMPGTPGTWSTTSPCPAGYSTIVTNAGAWGSATISAAKYWKLCTLLESGTAPNIYCVTSLQL